MITVRSHVSGSHSNGAFFFDRIRNEIFQRIFFSSPPTYILVKWPNYVLNNGYDGVEAPDSRRQPIDGSPWDRVSEDVSTWVWFEPDGSHASLTTFTRGYRTRGEDDRSLINTVCNYQGSGLYALKTLKICC